MWQQKLMWVVTLMLRDQDADGEDLCWSDATDQYYADTREAAEQLRDRCLSGNDEYYGDLIDDAIISDEPVMVDVMV